MLSTSEKWIQFAMIKYLEITAKPLGEQKLEKPQLWLLKLGIIHPCKSSGCKTVRDQSVRWKNCHFGFETNELGTS